MVALIYNNIPLSYAQDNSTMNNTPMTNLNQTEEEKENNETNVERDSVTELLQ